MRIGRRFIHLWLQLLYLVSYSAGDVLVSVSATRNVVRVWVDLDSLEYRFVNV